MASSPIPDPAPPSPARDAALLACVFGLLYLLLGQNSLHNYDLLAILRQVEHGETRHFQHLLYVPVAAAWRGLLEVFGVSAYASYRALSALGAALGVFGCHRAASVLGAGRARCLYTTILCGALPALMNSATLAEIDAVFFGIASLCWWSWARMVRDGSWSTASITGVCSGLAAATHAAGHLLAPALACTALGWRWSGGARLHWAGLGALLGGAHLGVFLGLAALLGGAAEQGTMAGNTLAGALPLDLWPLALCQEWLLPYFPASVLVLVTLLRPQWRAPGIAFLVVLLGYLAVTVAIFSHLRQTASMTPQGELLERGAFLLGLAFPCALLGVVVLRGPRRLVACAAALGVGLATVHVNDWQEDLPEFAEGLHAFVQQEPAEVLVEGVEELGSVWKRYPDAPIVGVNALAALLAGHPEAGYEHVRLWFDLRVQRLAAEGRNLLVTERALEWLLDSDEDALSRAAREHLPETYRMRPVGGGGFRAFRL